MENKNNINDFFDNMKKIILKLLDTKESNEVFEKKDIEDNKFFAILSYIIPFVPYFFIKDSKWVKYHSKEGMNFLIIFIMFSVISSFLFNIFKINSVCGMGYSCTITPWFVRIPISIINALLLLIGIVGIINVLKEKARPLPIVEKFKILK